MKEAVEVTIFGQQFTVRADVPPAEVLRVAAYVNRKIDEVAAAGRLTDSLKIVILALLNVAGEHLRGTGDADADPEVAGRLRKIISDIDRCCPELKEGDAESDRPVRTE